MWRPVTSNVPLLPVTGISQDVQRFLILIVAPPWPDPTDALFSHRSQYNAAKIIKHLAADIHAPVRRIGIISQDISLPFLTYVFGEAQIGGRAAVLSTYRLQRHRDGVCQKNHLFTDVWLK